MTIIDADWKISGSLTNNTNGTKNEIQTCFHYAITFGSALHH